MKDKLSNVFMWCVASSISLLCTNVAFSQMDLLVCVGQDNSVDRFDAQTGAYLGKFIRPNSGGLNCPIGIVRDPNGDVLVASSTSNEILKYDGESGEFLETFSSDVVDPWDLEVDSGILYVTSDSSNSFIKRFNAITGQFIDDFIPSRKSRSIVIEGDSIYVAEIDTMSVSRYDRGTGAFEDKFISFFGVGPYFAFKNQNDWLVGGFANLERYTSSGSYIDSPPIGGGAPWDAKIGPGQDLFIADSIFGQIHRYDRLTYEFVSTFAEVDTTNRGTGNFTFRLEGENVFADSLNVVQGISSSADVAKISASDQDDLVILRNPTNVASVVSFEVTGTTANKSPSSFQFRLEASVFARHEVVQTIEFLNNLAVWEQVDSRKATRFTDSLVTVLASGDLSRFQNSNGEIRARIRFNGALPRHTFGANIDLAFWSID